MQTALDLWTSLVSSIPEPMRPTLARTALLLLVVGLARFAVSSVLRNTNLGNLDDRRRWLVAVRNIAVVIAIAGVVTLWAQELQTLLLSLVALGAALVLAFKELINCLSGALVRTSTGAFTVGDRIEINGVRGDVIDHNLVSTTLMEVGPGSAVHQYTGRAVVVPNAWFLTHPVFNETYTDDYLLHSFTVAIPRTADWHKAELVLLAAAEAECGPWLEDAKKYLEMRARKGSLDPMAPEPRVVLRLHDHQRYEFLVRIPVPTRKKGKSEQAIVRRYLEEMEPPPQPHAPVHSSAT